MTRHVRPMPALPIPDERQPVQRWAERIATAIACFAIGFAVMVWVIR